MRLQSHLLWRPGCVEAVPPTLHWHFKLSSFLCSFFIMKWSIHAKFYKSSLKGYFLSSLPLVYLVPPRDPARGELFLLSSNPRPQDTVERAFALPQDPRTLTGYITSSESVQIQLVSSLSLQGGLSGHRHPESCSPGVWFHICTDFSGTA